MRLARAETDNGLVNGELEDKTLVTENNRYKLGREAELRAPCEPAALYCLGRNYAETIEQMDYEQPSEPDFFIKGPTSVHPPDQPVPYPHFSEQVTYAGELAAVIDTEVSDLSPTEVPDIIRGYTIMNDLDALDQQGRTARKAFDGSAPLGPWIETDLDPTDISMHTDVAGERRQEATTELMLFDPYEAISFISQRITLRPDDVVAFGSPANPGVVEPGDEVAIKYEGIGTLRNSVIPPE